MTAKEVVLSEKPLISEETDLIEPTLLDELICHIGSLASVYHKPPSAFVEGSHGIHRKHLPVQHSRSDADLSATSVLRIITSAVLGARRHHGKLPLISSTANDHVNTRAAPSFSVCLFEDFPHMKAEKKVIYAYLSL